MSKTGLIGMSCWALLVLAVACAPAPQPSAPPEAHAEPPPAHQMDNDAVVPAQPPENERPITTPDEAEEVFTDEEAELDKLLEGGGPPEALGTSRCTRLCNSLRSMRRAVGSLCEMTGEDDDRCMSARERLRTNERRITDAGCSC